MVTMVLGSKMTVARAEMKVVRAKYPESSVVQD